jgi:S1-C subfamily serine protease
VVGYPPSEASPRPGAKRRRLIGTAIALSDRRILTSASIAIPGGSVRVLLKGGIERPAVLLGIDRASNIALFQVEGVTLHALNPAPPQSLAIGAWVAVISNVAVTRPQTASRQIVGT